MCLSPISIFTYDELASSNSEAMARALAGQPPPFWVLATRQTAGRGRSGRTWQSQAGNLASSLVVATAVEPAKAATLSLLAGLATVRALRAALVAANAALVDAPSADPSRIRLKWPNDILIDRAKAGGILIETARVGAPPAPLVAVIGIGLNLRSAPQIDGRPTGALSSLGLDLTPSAAVAALSREFEALLPTWELSGGEHAIADQWLQHALPLGEPMTVDAGRGPIPGRFAGLGPDGGLLLDTADGQRHFTFGDVTL